MRRTRRACRGSRSSLGYGIYKDGTSWQRFGQILGAELSWESSRLGGPTLRIEAGDDASIDRLDLYFTGGVPDRERIGLAQRSLPRLF